jgi:hypothetical protein
MPTKDNFTTGLLTGTQAGFVARPAITLKGTPAAAGTGDYTVNLSIEALMPFGESSSDLYYKGTQIDLLRFSRPGVAVNPATCASPKPHLIGKPLILQVNDCRLV